jgi:hypothetical protein
VNASFRLHSDSVQRIFSVCVPLKDGSVEISDDAAEQLLQAASNCGVDWPEVAGQIDCQKAATMIADVCAPYLDRQFALYVQRIKDENSDRANLQLQSVERHYLRQLEERQNRRNQYASSGKQRLIPAIEGQLRALETSTQLRRQRITERANISSRCTEVGLGVLLVEP